MNWGDAPRAGEGWSVVRPGDVLPMDPGDPPEYEAYAEAPTEAVTGESVAVEATVSSADHHAVASVDEASDLTPVAGDEAATVSSDVVAAHVVAEDSAVPDPHAADDDHGPPVDSITHVDVSGSGAADSGRDSSDAVSDSDDPTASVEASGHHQPASHTTDHGAVSAEADGATAPGSGPDGAEARPKGQATDAPTGEAELPGGMAS